MATAMARAAASPAEPASGEPISTKRLAWEAARARDLEEKMGQGAAHAQAVELFVQALRALLAEQGRAAYVGWDVFVEWDPNDPRARVSPDAFILEGQAPEALPAMWQTWDPGCDPPRFALEIVSDKSRTKDYDQSPLRYAALGAEELAIFDPEPRGEGAFVLQLYRRTPRGQFLRAYAGSGPVESEALGAWIVVTNGGKHVRLARGADGTELVRTAEEQLGEVREQAASAEAEAASLRERAAAAEARVRELEATLAARR